MKEKNTPGTGWQQDIKQLIDALLSIAALLLLSPLLIYIMIRTRLSSPGNIFYQQERIGRNGKAFTIYKFRSMHPRAEESGPALSGDNDLRITSWGRVMRKWKLDELPQLWNVLLGDMSLVGPRPERKFYIEQIIEQVPEYAELLRVKPGVTSLGMIRYGYASTIEQMIERMEYDLDYVRHFSLALDARIMVQTVLIILSGKAK